MNLPKSAILSKAASAFVLLGMLIPGTLQAQGWINVLDYGADPTGVEDSTQAIRDAIDAARAYSYNGPNTSAIIGVDGFSIATEIGIEPVTPGGTVYFPRGEYTISGTLDVKSVRLTAAPGTELQAINPVAGQSYSYSTTSGEDGTYEVFRLYGTSAVDNLFLDICEKNAAGADYDPSGDPAPNLTWFTAKSVDTNPANVFLSNLETPHFSNGAKAFFRNDVTCTLHASHVHFYTSMYGFKVKYNDGDIMLQDVRGVGFAPTKENPHYVAGSAFILSSDSNDVNLSDCYGAHYESGLSMIGGYPKFHGTRMTNTRFECTRIGVKIDGGDANAGRGPAIPGIIMTNCELDNEEYNIVGNVNVQQVTSIDRYRGLQMSNCRLTFTDDKTSDAVNQMHINMSGFAIPISIMGCRFSDRIDRATIDPLNSSIYFAENGAKPIVFSGNTVEDVTSAQFPVYFVNTRSAMVIADNNLRSKSTSFNNAMLISGVWTAASIQGNVALGKIEVWDNGTIVTGVSGKYCITNNVTEH